MVTYAAKFGEPISIAVPSRVGAQQEAYCSALGKVLLSGLTEDQLEEYLRDGKLIALTPQTITDSTRLRAEIGAVRQRGYSIDDREAHQTICCIGAPIRDPRRPDHRRHFDGGYVREHGRRGWRDEVSAALISTAARITQKVYPAHAWATN